MNYEVKSAKEASINEIFFDKNTNKLSYKNKYGIVVELESAPTPTPTPASTTTEVEVYCGLDWAAPVYDMSQTVADIFPNYNYPFTYSEDGKILFLNPLGFVTFQTFDINGTDYSVYTPNYGKIDKIMFKGDAGPYGIKISNFLIANGFTDPLPIELDLNKTGSITIDNINPGIDVIKLPSTCNTLSLSNISVTIELFLTDVTEVASLEIFNCASLGKVDISSMINMGASIDRSGSYIYIASNPNLEKIITPTNLKTAPYNINFDTNKLNQISVDAILNMLVKLDGTNNTQNWGIYSENLDLSGGSNAAPSPAGLADVATLVARGATITHN